MRFVVLLVLSAPLVLLGRASRPDFEKLRLNVVHKLVPVPEQHNDATTAGVVNPAAEMKAISQVSSLDQIAGVVNPAAEMEAMQNNRVDVSSLDQTADVVNPAAEMEARRNKRAEVSSLDQTADTKAVIQKRVEVLELVNEARRNAGVPALVLNRALITAAERHSRDMATNDFVNHTGSDGSSGGDRLNNAGYSWRAWAENIAHRQTSSQEVVQDWLDSSGHRTNILASLYTDMGYGESNTYHTQIFAAPRR